MFLIVGLYFGTRVSLGLANARANQQFERNAAHDDAVVLLVSDAVEIGQADGRDDAAGKTGPLDQQRFGTIAGRGHRGTQAGTTAAADEHVGLQFLRHLTRLPPRTWECPCL